MMKDRLTRDELFMYRCIELAKLGAGNVAPNPMVGAVLVYEEKIIGEGFHENYGQAHAEVNCINSVSEENKSFISRSTLYVSLEPCTHHGKTPPCSDLIIQYKIPKVVISIRDPFKEVNGKGIEKLRSAGVEVIHGILEEQCKELNKRFFTFHTHHRPYVLLKWAQTADGKMSSGTGERLYISNEITNRLVHKWRSEEAAILVGTNTALLDDPALNVRSWTGTDPVRLVIDMGLGLPSHLKLFDESQRTIVFNTIKHQEDGNPGYYQVTADVSLVRQLLNACYQLNIQSILVEGGSKMLQSFIDDGCWDEARVITNTSLFSPAGLSSPVLTNGKNLYNQKIGTDEVAYFRNEGR
jgi:diaminohydroxyphosphoribosylaminopyrimidine deaminase / 5-amino-6-(5-phosphoribosylamino)uracil reductase